MRVLEQILGQHAPAFAILHRPDSGAPDAVDVLVGEPRTLSSLAEMPALLPPDGPGAHDGAAAHRLLLVVPYRQIAERGFAAPDDGTPLVAITVTDQDVVPLAELRELIPDVLTTVSGGHFDTDDDRYAATVRRIVAEEIGTGEGSNFVIKRSFVADIGDYSLACALAFFRRLLDREHGAYWTFIVHTGARTLVGATPERHVTVDGGTAVMNPISGTYRYPPGGPTLEGLEAFLADDKEVDELYMVVDEELKMMARVCDAGGRLAGPYLKEMAQLAHTEYFIEGRTSRDVSEILSETMFAPTVVGSPLESATRVIHRHEPEGRGYYSGVAALIGSDGAGRPALDSAILIRTADIDSGGRLRIGVGATLVRHSDPASEVEETRAKAAGLLSALTGPQRTRFRDHPTVRATLARRNAGIADFWRADARAGNAAAVSSLAGVRSVVVDAEDTFTAMIGHQLGSLGLEVTVRRFDERLCPDAYDLVVMGPGPGDPRAVGDGKIDRLRGAIDELLRSRIPFLAVCLSHQILARRLGLEVRRLPTPNQGVARDIALHGRPQRVGFYNTFAAYCAADVIAVDGVGGVEVCREPATGEVHALRGSFFGSMQFHAESILTVDGPAIVGEAVRGALRR
jgi:phenazine biosynthesis protein phzE